MKGVLAALMFFTRLPLWRIVKVEGEYFRDVVNFWPYAGIFTGGLAALTILASAIVFPPVVAVVLGISARVLITGALHEDGLADFFDGFGGGVQRDKILKIMKDSFIGSYGVLGLILYFALLVATLASLPPVIAAALIFCGDILNKFIAGNIVNFLPYARSEGESKNGVVYNRIPVAVWLVNLLFTAAVLGWFCWRYLPFEVVCASIAPVVAFALLVNFMRRKIGGYTGDCCGAMFLLCELSFYLASLAVLKSLI